MPTFKCSYFSFDCDIGEVKIEASSYEQAATLFADKFPASYESITVKKGIFGEKLFKNPYLKKVKEEAQKAKEEAQKAKEDALAHIIQKVTDGDAERLSYGEINAVVENFFAHDESFRKEEADLRCRLYALTLTNSTLQGLIQTTILSRLISGNSSNGAGATTSGGNSMGKALVAASLLNNQQLKGMAEDVEDISEGFGFDEE